MRFVMLTSVVLVAMNAIAPGTARGECAKRFTVDQLGQVAHEGEDAFFNIDLTNLLKQAARARTSVLPCLNRAITPADAAVFHRLMALEAFVNQDHSRAVGEYHASLKFDPGYTLPSDLPEQHGLRKLAAEALTTSDGDAEFVFPPDGGHVTVGGVRGAPRPGKTPVIIQAFDKQGALLETRYVEPGQTLPSWGKFNPLGVTAKDLGIDTRSTLTKPNTWYYGAIGVGIIAGVFYGLALSQKSAFNDTSTDDDDLSGHLNRANAFGWTAIGMGSLALALVGTGITMRLSFGGEDETEVSAHVFR